MLVIKIDKKLKTRMDSEDDRIGCWQAPECLSLTANPNVLRGEILNGLFWEEVICILDEEESCKIGVLPVELDEICVSFHARIGTEAFQVPRTSAMPTDGIDFRDNLVLDAYFSTEVDKIVPHAGTGL